jgi:outer membrane receptor protein involved in Fe transport
VIFFAAFGFWSAHVLWADITIPSTCTGVACNVPVTADRTEANVTITGNDEYAYDPTENPANNIWPTLVLDENVKLTVTGTFEATGTNSYDTYSIIGKSGSELIIADEAIFKNTSASSIVYTEINLNRLTLQDGATATFSGTQQGVAPGLGLSNAGSYVRINGGITLGLGSKIILENRGSITNNSNGSGLLSVTGDGRTAAEFIIAQNITSATSIQNIKLHVNGGFEFVLLDDGDYGSGSVILHVDNSVITDQNVINASGISKSTASPLRVTVAVQNAQGESSGLKNQVRLGDQFYLIDKLDNDASQFTNVNFTQTVDGGGFMDYTLGVTVEGDLNNRALVGTWRGIDTLKSRPLLDGMMGGVMALQNGADLLEESGLPNAMCWAWEDGEWGWREGCGSGDGLSLFSAFGGYFQELQNGGDSYGNVNTSGTHVAGHTDYKGFSFLVGAAYNNETSLGRLTAGAFLEGGSGAYDTHTEIRNRTTDGSGDNNYFGAGLLLRHDFYPGYYAEASVRAGRIKTDFDVRSLANAKYDVSSPYLGAHAGGGYRYEYKSGLLMDAYAKFFWTRIGDVGTTIVNGHKLDFDETDFMRSRLGLRYTLPVNDRFALNFGGAWDYGFGGGTGVYKGKIDDMPLAPGYEPTIEGSAGFLEMGLDYKPFEGNNLSLSLSGKAYLGKVEGGSGALQLKYDFGGPEQPSSWARGGYLAPSSGDASGRVSTLTGKLSGRLAQSAAGEDEAVDLDGSAVALETVTVYSEPDWKQVLSPGAVTVVSTDDFQGEQRDLGDYLDRVPGLHVTRRGGDGQYATVNVRGSTAAQVAVYVDGVPQNLSGDAAVDLSLFPMENVARIEVYRGYVPVRFVGAPIGGVINIVTKKPMAQSTTVYSGVTSLGGFKAGGTFTSPLLGGSLMLTANRDQSDGDYRYTYYNNEEPYEMPNPRWRQANDYQNSDVMLKWQSENWLFKASWKEIDRAYPSNSDQMTDNSSDNWPTNYERWRSYNRDNRQQVLQKDFSLGYRDTFMDSLEIGLQFDYTLQNKNYEWLNHPPLNTAPFDVSPGAEWSRYDTERWAVNLDASYKLGERHLLEFRGDFSREALDVDGSNYQGTNAGDKFALRPQYSQDRSHLQLQDTVTLNDAQDLWLTLVLRSDKVESDSEELSDNAWHYTWGLGLKKNVGEHWTLKGSYGTFVRYPNFYELYGDSVYIKPNAYVGADQVPAVGTEEGEQWDIGVDWRGQAPLLDVPGTLSAGYFFRRTENMIGLYQTPKYVYYGNYGNTWARGVEVEGGLRWSQFDLDFSATWMESKLVDVVKVRLGYATQWIAEGQPLLNSPEWEYFVRGTYRHPKYPLSLFAELHHSSEIPVRYTNVLLTTYYSEKLAIANLGLKVDLWDGLQLTAGVNDVFNRGPEQILYNDRNHYRRTVDFPLQGRVYYATLRCAF